MTTKQQLEEFTKRYNLLTAEKEDLAPRKKRALRKLEELTETLNDLKNTENNCRKTALISCLSTSFTMSFIPLFGVWFAIVPIVLLITTIIQSARIFRAEDKITKTEKDLNTCKQLIESYDESIIELEKNVNLLSYEINEFVAKDTKTIVTENSTTEILTDHSTND